MSQASERSLDATLVGGEETSASLTTTGRTTSPILPRGSTVGRYVVLDRLGAGGMGMVYRAIDPKLERMVAVKLLRFGEDEDAEAQHARLLREAQAMARVRHPNVVTVHDVGVQDGRVYVAMELVEGQTLSAWIRAEPRPWSQVLEVFVAAGRGLAAAHEEHLVHRDFKPDNVMVTERGRVVVMDFGLARGRELPPDELEVVEPSVSGSALLSSELTRAGALVGTPPYMSPEQLSGEDADARSDQFAFCVALFEGLYGERPFQADGVMALVLAITKGRIIEPAGGARVPRWLHRVVLRGLCGDPEARWPSMEALLAVLEDPPQRRRRRRLVQVGVAAGVTGALALAWVQSRRPDERCTGGAERLSGVWDGQRRQDAERALDALNVTWGGTVTAALAELDRYAEAWIDMHTEACRATVVHRAQSQETLELRAACLERVRGELSAVADRLATMDAAVAREADALARGLPSLSRCADVEALRAEVPLPQDPRDKETLARLRDELARAKASSLAGKYEDASQQLDRLAPEVEALGHEPLQARFFVERGFVDNELGHHEAAREALERALDSALAQGQTQLAFTSARLLTIVVAQEQQHPGEGLVFARLTASLARRPSSDLHARIDAQSSLGLAHARAGNAREAEASRRRALALDDGEEPSRTIVLHNALGDSLLALERYDEALEHHEQAMRLGLEHFGPEHPRMITLHNGLANVLFRLHRFAESGRHHRRALAIGLATFGETHPSIAMSRFNLSNVLAEDGRLEDAIAELDATLGIIEASLGRDHPRAGMVHTNLAALQLQLGDPVKGEAHARRSLEILTKTLGEDHLETGSPRSLLGVALERQDRTEEAEQEQARTLEIQERELGPDHIRVLKVITRLGRLRTKLGRHAEGIALLERGLAGFEGRTPRDEEQIAEVRFTLGRALWDTQLDRDRAVALVRQARDAAPEDDDRARMAAWLREHVPDADR